MVKPHKQLTLDSYSQTIFSNNWILEHVNYNIQCCPVCYQAYARAVNDAEKEAAIKVMYNVVWKKKLSKGIDKWYCKSCKGYFRLNNKYVSQKASTNCKL